MQNADNNCRARCKRWSSNRSISAGNRLCFKRTQACRSPTGPNLLLVSADVSENQFECGGLFTSVADRRRIEQFASGICFEFQIIDTLQSNLKPLICGFAMNPLKISCPHCQQHIECDAAYGGTEIQCPTCVTPILVPTATEATPLPAGGEAFPIEESRPELRGFNDFYRREMAPSLNQWRRHYRAARTRKIWIGRIGFAIMSAAAGVGIYYRGLGIETLIVCGVVAIPFALLAQFWTGSLEGAAKGFLLLETCRFFGFSYQEEAPPGELIHFKEAGLLPEFNHSKVEDFFQGNHQGIEFRMFECELEWVTRGNDRDHYSRVYNGLLFRFDFPKKFRGRTLALKEAGAVGNFLKDFKMKGQRVKLEDPRFEKLFEVWGDDQVEARYLLTPTFMERIVELARTIHSAPTAVFERTSNPIQFCFFEHALLLSVETLSNQFEVCGPQDDSADGDTGAELGIEKIVNEICRVFDIVNTLQLTLKTRS